VAELISTRAEDYALAHTTAFDGPIASAAEWTEHNTNAPQMMSGLAEARLLEALVVAGRARRVLEIGTFTAVGTLAMAAAVGPDGQVITLELSAEYAAVARRHIDASPHADRVKLIVGDALDTIAGLDGPFDLVYIDAWKTDYPAYYDLVIERLAPGGVIVADNLFRNGVVLDPDNQEEGTLGMREFARRVHADERTDNVLLTIGDGVMLAWHRPPELRRGGRANPASGGLRAP
jgi:caffeoyl-CoA O-methyltransferase